MEADGNEVVRRFSADGNVGGAEDEGGYEGGVAGCVSGGGEAGYELR